MAYPPVKILHVINIPTDSTPPAEGLETITAPVETTTSVPTTENIGTASTPAHTCTRRTHGHSNNISLTTGAASASSTSSGQTEHTQPETCLEIKPPH